MGKKWLAIAFAVLCTIFALVYASWSGWKDELQSAKKVYDHGVTVGEDTYPAVRLQVESRAASAYNLSVVARRYVADTPLYDSIRKNADLLMDENARLPDKAAAYDALCGLCPQLLALVQAQPALQANERDLKYIAGFVQGEQAYTNTTPITQYNAYVERLLAKATGDGSFRLVTGLIPIERPELFLAKPTEGGTAE